MKKHSLRALLLLLALLTVIPFAGCRETPAPAETEPAESLPGTEPTETSPETEGEGERETYAEEDAPVLPTEGCMAEANF